MIESVKCLHVGVDVDEKLVSLNGVDVVTLAREFGAVLIRGLADLSPVRCQEILAEWCGGRWHPYKTAPGHTGRRKLAENIYTASLYDPACEIPLHHEGMQKNPFPGVLYFACELPASTGGATQLVQTRNVLGLLSEFARDRLLECGISWKEAYGFTGCREWTSAFNIKDPDELEGFFRSANMQWEWHGDDRLSVTVRRPAFMRHPADGSISFTNTMLPYLSDYFSSNELRGPTVETTPSSACESIGDNLTTARILAELASAYKASTYRLKWSAGDLLVVDNILMAHGRDSFTGDRKLHFATSHPVEVTDRNQVSGIAHTRYAD